MPSENQTSSGWRLNIVRRSSLASMISTIRWLRMKSKSTLMSEAVPEPIWVIAPRMPAAAALSCSERTEKAVIEWYWSARAGVEVGGRGAGRQHHQQEEARDAAPSAARGRGRPRPAAAGAAPGPAWAGAAGAGFGGGAACGAACSGRGGLRPRAAPPRAEPGSGVGRSDGHRPEERAVRRVSGLRRAIGSWALAGRLRKGGGHPE